MKKLLPLRGYYLRARIFGYMMAGLLIFAIGYFLMQLLQG